MFKKFIRAINNSNFICLEIQKENDRSVFLVKCRRCGLLLGMKLNEDIFFIKKKIKIRNKILNINIISLNQSLIDNFTAQLRSLLQGEKVFVFHSNKHKKESLDKFTYTKKEFDVTFIIHKIEGRVFLLGKNGFYNTICRELKRKLCHNVYFILLLKENCSYFNSGKPQCEQMIKNLIKNGQNELDEYFSTNRILFLSDFELEESVKSNKSFFDNVFFSHYENAGNFQKHFELFNTCAEETKEVFDKDVTLIKSTAEYIENAQMSLFSKCKMI